MSEFADFTERRIPPRTVFYMRVMDGNLDGTIDLNSEMPTVYGKLNEAVTAGKEDADGRMGESWIYECRPVRRVRYGDVVVETIAAKPK